ncbi:hypothetical protein BKA60DRAFT_555896 [Fusarium oxysporum]|nr:hypothetical protein BKA60DRAFT_555896 [Fusarium oxysporum]
MLGPHLLCLQRLSIFTEQMKALGFLVSANLRIAIATITVFSQSFESLTFVFFVMKEILWVVVLTIYYLAPIP